jgi:hypothetical protein
MRIFTKINQAVILKNSIQIPHIIGIQDETNIFLRTINHEFIFFVLAENKK